MPAKTALLYIQHKYVHETVKDRFMMDMLWAPANGMQFKNSSRYHELVADYTSNKGGYTKIETVEDVVNMFKSSKGKMTTYDIDNKNPS